MSGRYRPVSSWGIPGGEHELSCASVVAVNQAADNICAIARLDRIVADPAIVHGKPAVRGTRITVQTILELLAAGESIEELLAEDDELERDDVLARRRL